MEHLIEDCKNMIFEIQVVNVLVRPHNIMICVSSYVSSFQFFHVLEASSGL